MFVFYLCLPHIPVVLSPIPIVHAELENADEPACECHIYNNYDGSSQLSVKTINFPLYFDNPHEYS